MIVDGIAARSPDFRADLFEQTAAGRPRLSPSAIEKDFWVCWTLRRIFEVLRFRPQLIFKGGTSLSKAYQAIERFSEDVDLSLSRSDLGFSDARDPEEPGIGRKESGRRLQCLVDCCREVIRGRLLPDLRADFASVIGTAGWSLELDVADPQTIIFGYPRADVEGGLPGYIRPAVRLELGARSDDWPAEEREIRAYAAEAFPQAFTVAPSCHVRVLQAVRTFWEKATLLHAQYHRPAGKAPPDGLSRHYYDLCRLCQQEAGRRAMGRLDLLERVVIHKRLFFAAAWAHYDTAVPGSLRLVPPAEHMPPLRADYARMGEMIFGDVPPWDEIIHVLRQVENRVNGAGGR